VSDDATISGVLKSVGLTGLDKIRFGEGVVGKMTTSLMGLFVLCVAVVAAGTWMQTPLMIYIALGVGIVAFIFKAVASMFYAARNPSVALLEGAELVKYHQIDMAAKNVVIPSGQENIRAPLIETTNENAESVRR
jgi:hypothetical protein